MAMQGSSVAIALPGWRTEHNATLRALQTNTCGSGEALETQKISKRKPPTTEAWKGQKMGGSILRRCRASPLSHSRRRQHDQNGGATVAGRVHALGKWQRRTGRWQVSTRAAQRIRRRSVPAVPAGQVETIDERNLRKPDQSPHPDGAREHFSEGFLAEVTPGIPGTKGRCGIVIFSGRPPALGPQRHS